MSYRRLRGVRADRLALAVGLMLDAFGRAVSDLGPCASEAFSATASAASPLTRSTHANS